jgi:hypothetical protein
VKLDTNLFSMEGPAMKRITVSDRWQIKQLLYGDSVLGVRDENCQAFGGFQLWWYDKRHNACHYCQSTWVDLRRQVSECTLDQAADALWRHRDALFVRGRQLSQDRKLLLMTQLCN